MFFHDKRYYLDYAAATPVHPRVFRAMQPFYSEMFANANSIHTSGRAVHHELESCERSMHALGSMGRDDHIVWTSGGTESNERAIDYAIHRWKAQHPDEPYTVAISSIEHPSVVDYLESRQDHLLRIEYIPVNKEGRIDLDWVRAGSSQWENLILVSCIFQSSEVGTTQPIKDLATIVHKHKSQTGCDWPLVHTDASQGVLYHTVNFQDWGVDMVTLCSQKVHGPKGVGALLSKQDIEIEREGTPTVGLIVGFTTALQLATKNRERNTVAIRTLRKELFRQLDKREVEYEVNGSRESDSLIINLSFPSDTRDSEMLVVAFDQAGLEVSSKSACMGSQAEDSRVLSAMGKHPRNSIRISVHHGMSTRDIKAIAKRIAQVVK